MKKQLLYLFTIALFTQSAILAQDNCLLFDGANARVRYDNDATLDALNNATDYTIEVWVKPTDADIHSNVIIRRWGQFSITLYQDANRRVYFTANDVSPSAHINSLYDVININEWNHIAVICNSTDDSTILYVNGVDVTANPDGSATTKPAFTLNDPGSSANFYIGYGGGGTVPFAYIDKIRVKKNAETIANLQTSITDTNYSTDSDTVALFYLNEGTGTTTVNTANGVNANLQCVGGCAEIPTWETVANTLSIDENNTTEFSLFPNPVKDEFVTIQARNNEIIQKVELTDLQGKLVKTISLNTNENNVKVSTKGLNTGLYILKTTTNEGIGTKKLVIE
jgi:hypothetical protein